MTKHMKMPHNLLLRLKNHSSSIWPCPSLCLLVFVTNTLTYICRYLCSSEEEFVPKGWIFWLSLDQWLALSWEDITQSKTPAQELMQAQDWDSALLHQSLVSKLLNRKLHLKTQRWCEDTDPRLVSFLSLPLGPKRARAWQSGWPACSGLFQHPSKDLVCDYTDAESKPSGTQWLRKTSSRVKEAAGINASSKLTGWCLRKLHLLWIRCICF